MKFSVIVPCYNCAGTLETTVNSIRSSGLTDYELLLIDDGSTDGTGALCDRLCRQYTEIRCIHQENAGVSTARNRGIDKARGTYIWFVDADDTVESGTVTDAVDITCRQQPDMLMFGMSFDYYHNGKRYRQDFLLPPHNGMLSQEQLKARFQEFYACNALTPVCNKFIRRDLLTNHAIRFREDMILMEDFLLVLDALPHCESIYCLPVALYCYRQGEDERGAYRRLQRIPDLAAYIKPFEQSMKQLGIPDGDKRIDGFYRMLLWQKMQYSGLKDIRRTVAIHESGARANMGLTLDPMRIYLSNRKTLLRHRLAVVVKSTALYQRIKAVHK